MGLMGPYSHTQNGTCSVHIWSEGLGGGVITLYAELSYIQVNTVNNV